MSFGKRVVSATGRYVLSRLLVGFSALLLACAVACGGDDARAPRLSQPDAVGVEVTTEYLTLLQKKDGPGLQRFLSDAFIIQRADGSSATKTDYLLNLPTVGPYEISEVRAQQDGDTLVVHWRLSVHELINEQIYKSTPTPRLSTFAWSEGRWHLISHANFNAPAPTSGTVSGR